MSHIRNGLCGLPHHQRVIRGGGVVAINVSHKLTLFVPVTQLEENKNVRESLESFYSWVTQIEIL